MLKVSQVIKQLDIRFSFAIFGVIIVLTAFGFWAISCNNERTKGEKDNTIEYSRLLPNEDMFSTQKAFNTFPPNSKTYCVYLNQKTILIVLTIVFIMVSEGRQLGFSRFLTAFAVHGQYHLSSQTGALMTSLFCATMTVMRLPFILMTNYYSITAAQNIVIGMALLVLGHLVMYAALIINVNSVGWLFWVSIVVLATGTSSFLPQSVHTSISMCQ